MSTFAFVFLMIGICGITTSLLFSLNNIIKTIYYWEREVIFNDYSNPKEVYIRFPNESLTSDALSRKIKDIEIYERFELGITENGNVYVPYANMLTGIVDIFLDYRNLIGALQNAQEEYQEDPEELELFKGPKKFDFPSVIHELGTYNMYTKYTLWDLDNDKQIFINSIQDYSAFVRRVIENKSNLSYRTHYMVYKKIGNKEDGQLVSELTTLFNIGQDYQDMSNRTPIMDVQYLSESRDARKNS